MKALSLKQPWAELIVRGKKKIELRKWNTKFRGEFLIHASKKSDKDSMKKFNFSILPLGCIVGKAELVDVVNYGEDRKRFERDEKLHLADESWENFGFMLKNPARVKEIKCKGSLGFWNFEENVHNKEEN